MPYSLDPEKRMLISIDEFDQILRENEMDV